MASLETWPGPGPHLTYVLADGPAVAHLVPGRGGLVTRFAVRGDELLYLDEATLAGEGNVRGGIPLLFPLAGKGLERPPYALPQHGFARGRPWEVLEAVADESTALVRCRLVSDDATRAHFPHDFEAVVTVSLAGERLTLEWEVRNRGATPLPLHLGLHPYLRVAEAEKGEARLETKATRARLSATGELVDFAGLDFRQANDVQLLDHGQDFALLSRGGGGAPVQLSWTPGFTTVVVWTVPGKDFVCVEPWTAPGGALGRGEVPLLPPGASTALAVAFSRAG